VLACTGEDRPDCLTAAQLDGVRTIYEPAKNPRTGADIFPGLERGSEMSWNLFRSLPPDYFTNVVFADPHWDFTTFDFDSGVALTDQRDDGMIKAIDPNLQPFFSRGGKLLLYHGWSDPAIPPRNTIQYYESVARALGGDSAAGSIRLFMVPGMVHCDMSGSEGANEFDTVGALDRWVEQHQPPIRFIASHRPRGGVADDRTHALCPYPQVAVYGGSGSVTDAANFICRVR
jgi:feruloyl esterase